MQGFKVEAGGRLGPAAKKGHPRGGGGVRGGEESSGEQDYNCDRSEVMHKQAYIHDGHFAEDEGQASLDDKQFYQWCFWAYLGFLVCRLLSIAILFRAYYLLAKATRKASEYTCTYSSTYKKTRVRARVRTLCKSMMMTQLIAKVPFPARAQVCVFLRCL